MKKLLTMILALALILPVAASAATHVSEVYTLFIDAYTLNREYQAGFDFDSMIFDLIVLSDGKTAYYNKQTWTDGIRTATEIVECGFSSDGDDFVIHFPNGDEFKGYFDPDGNGAWVNLGGTTYFRFSPAAHYDPVGDYTKK